MKFELMPLFDKQKYELFLISEEILRSNTNLDSLIYKLYELTDNEISIIENKGI